MFTILGWESIGQPLVVAHRYPSWSRPRVSAQTRLVLSWTRTRGCQASPVLHTVTLFPVTSWQIFSTHTDEKRTNHYRHIKVSSVVHGESVRLACFPADLLHRIADVLLVIQSLRFYSEELQAGQRRKVEEPGALTGRRNRQSIDIVVGYSEDKERGWLSSSLSSSLASALLEGWGS